MLPFAGVFIALTVPFMLPFAGVFIALTAGLFPFFLPFAGLFFCPNRGSFSLMIEKRLPYNVGLMLYLPSLP